jgi:hypothetical protein
MNKAGLLCTPKAEQKRLGDDVKDVLEIT